MEITPAGLGGVVEHSSSRQSESSEIDKMIGSAHVVQKSSSFEEEESMRMVSQSGGYTGGSALGPPIDLPYMPSEPKQDLGNPEMVPESIPQEQPNQYPEKMGEEKEKMSSDSTADNKIAEISVITGTQGTVQSSQNTSEENKAEEVVPSFRKRLSMNDKQTSTSSLEEQNKETERESAAECLLRVLSKEASTRPASLPSDLASLWHSLKIASELNKVIRDTKEDSEGASSDFQNGVAKPVDLQKLFTPAEDAPQIQPKKMFGNSCFYGPNHPTVEEQVELARRISSSLSDISNKESKGQSMYVNRKKRAVKWVHQEGEEQGYSEFSEQSHSENFPPTAKPGEKPILKLVMNPHGKVQDFSTLRGPAVDTTPSPEVCFDLVKDLNSPCGKGAEMFAKRRKKAEKWIVEDSIAKSTTEHTSMSSYESSYSSQMSSQTMSQSTTKMATPTLPPNIGSLPTLTYMKDIPARFGPTAAKNQIPDKYTQPKVMLIKSPWEAALEGNLDEAFHEPVARSPTPRGNVKVAPTPISLSKMATPPPPQSYTPSSELYLAKPPKAWHPQPTGKQFSSVKLENIFAGSAKSPVSLAYQSDTNTIRSKPVHVESVPQIATKLQDYEVYDSSILKEQTARRTEQVLADVEQNTGTLTNGNSWEATGQEDANGSIMWSATTSSANYASPQQEVKWSPESQETFSSTTQKTSSLMQSSESLTQIKPTVFIPTPKASEQPSVWKPPQEIQESLQTSLHQSLSEIQNVMSQTCQNFSKIESSETESMSLEEVTMSQEVSSSKEESKLTESVSVSTSEQIQQADSCNISEEIKSTETSNLNTISESSIDVAQNQETIETTQNETCELSLKISTEDKQKEQSIQQTDSEIVSQVKDTQQEELKQITSDIKESSSLMEQFNVQSQKVTDSFQQQMSESGAGFSSLQGFTSDSSKTFMESMKSEQSSQYSSDICFKKEEISSSSEQQLTMQSQSSKMESFFEQKQSEESISSSKMSSIFEVQGKDEYKSLGYSSMDGYSSFNESQSFSTLGNFEKSEFKPSHQETHAESNRLSLSVMSTTDEEVQDLCEREFNQVSMQYEKVNKPDIMKPAAIVPRGGVKIFPTITNFTPSRIDSNPPVETSQNGFTGGVVKGPAKKPYKKPPSMVPGAKPLFGEAIELHLGPEGDRPYEQIPVKNLIKTFEESTRPFMKSKSQEKIHEEMLQQQMYQQSSQQQSSITQLSSSQLSSYQQQMTHQSSYEQQMSQQSLYQQQFNQQSSYDQQMSQQSSYQQQINQQNSYQHQTGEESSFQQYMSDLSSLQKQSLSEQGTFRTSLYDTFPSDNIPSNKGDIKSQAPSVNKDWSQIQTPQSTSKQAAESPSNIHVDLSNVNNFNLAARGWKTNMSYYRPVTFQSAPTTAYSDF